MTDTSAHPPTQQRTLPGAGLGAQEPSWPAQHSLPATGDAEVDRLLAVLPELPDQDVIEHPAQYERLHQELLAALDAWPETN